MDKNKPDLEHPILYLGDDTVDAAAAYLAGVMAHHGLGYEHRPSNESLNTDVLKRRWSLIVISDYPAGNIPLDVQSGLADMVGAGMGLLMLGGWDSFQGLGGNYSGTRLGNILPVVLDTGDDRINSSGPCLISKVKNHPIVDGLPFASDTPGIGGFNRFEAKEDGEVVLESRIYRASADPDAGHIFIPESEMNPLLVTGTHGKGRVCAWASDVAPHWVGGLVDWGPERVEARGPGGAGAVEVGNLYAEFFRNMLLWTAGVMD
jgi:hypothetical protein